MENQTGKRIKVLRIDNGLEFCNSEFDKLYCDYGIQSHKIVVGTPQYNELVERMNRTILNKMRCMFSNSKLPKHLWVETIQVVTYLINMSLSFAINSKTLEELGEEYL